MEPAYRHPKNKLAPPPAAKPLAFSYIRFSSPEQAKGDSLTRQTEASEKYAIEHGLRIDHHLHLQDLGVSAYRGKNSFEGALSGFLAAVQTGRVPVGSTLLVESLDRLSRTQVTDALTQFLNIINHGITVVTLMDQMVYNREAINLNPANLMMSIVIMMRAHEESATKGARVAKAWSRKRQIAAETRAPQSRLCPSWITLTDTGYEVIPDRANLLVRMFELAAQGLGKRLIAKTLNREGIPPWGGGRRWADSTIHYLTKCPAALGVYQPHRLDPETHKRIPDGPPIENYYPAVITPELWGRAHSRPAAPTGRRGPRTNNLFMGLVYDGYSGEKMHYMDKSSHGQARNRGDQRFLRSDPNHTKGQFWPYANFEKLILDHLRQLDWEALANQSLDNGSGELLEQIARLESRRTQLQRNIDKFLNAFADTPAALQKAATDKATKLAEELEETQARIEVLRSQHEHQTADHYSVAEGLAEFRQLIQDSDPSKRLRLQGEIRRRVKSITAYRYGHSPLFKGTPVEGTPGDEWPCIVIEFRNGAKQNLVSSPIRKRRPQTRNPLPRNTEKASA